MSWWQVESDKCPSSILATDFTKRQATPGRAVDLIRARHMALFDLRVLVLDEADQMLEAGFAREVDYVLDAVPRDAKVQTLMFCATLPPRMLTAAQQACYRPVLIQVSEEGAGGRGTAGVRSSGASDDETTRLTREVASGEARRPDAKASDIVHRAMKAAAAARPAIISDVLLVDAPRKAIVFANTKLETVELAAALAAAGRGRGQSGESAYFVLHGDLPQFQRTRVMDEFKRSERGVLVATDVAARGIHVDQVDLVLHCGVPVSSSGAARRAKTSKSEVVNTEQFIHRTGRTGRMGAAGTSVLLFDPTAGEAALLPVLERAVGAEFVLVDAPAPDACACAAAVLAEQRLASVSDEAARLFAAEAERLLAKSAREDGVGGAGGQLLLARALAALGGVLQPPVPRSLLDGREGMRTICVHPLSPGEGGDALGAAAVTPSVVTDALRAALGVKKIGRVSLCKNGCAVVDVSAAHAQLVRFVVGCMGVRSGVESNLWEVC